MIFSLLLRLQKLREALPAFVTLLLVGISFLGEPYVPLILSFWFYWCLDKEAGTRLITVSSLADALNGVLKVACCVYRPWIRNPEIRPARGALAGATGYSFPSGHSTKSVAAYGQYFREKKGNRVLRIAIIVMILLILFSRCFLGVHTPHDVLVGGLLGLASLLLGNAVLGWSKARPGRDLVACGIGLVLCVIAMIFVCTKPYPVDTAADGSLLVDPVRMQHDTFMAIGVLIGLFIGFPLEKRFVRFSVEGTRRQRLVRFATGFCTDLFIYFVVRKLVFQPLLGTNWGSMVGTALAMLYAVYVHPLLFTRLRAKRNKPN